jgi:pyruvate/2-oxoglutarate dehydrogenase complex dihydrolipoamide acyltransferase (E2) component
MSMDEMELEQEPEYFEGENESTATLLGFGESEYEGEDVLAESDYENEDYEYEDYETEQFFGGLLKKALPIARNLIGKVAPKVASVIGGGGGGGGFGSLLGGLFGGGGGMPQQAAVPPMGDYVGGGNGADLGDFGGGFGDFESADMESDLEAAIAPPTTQQQALGKAMSVLASKAPTPTEAAAHMGAAVVLSLSPDDRNALQNLIPSLLRAATILTTALNSRPQTRVLMPIVPAAVQATVTTIRKRAAATGQPPTKKAAAVAMTQHLKRALQPDIAARATGRARKTARKVVKQRKPRPQAFSY